MHYVFAQIWNERRHESEIDGTPLPFEFGKHMFFVFSHILSRGAYGRRSMVLNKENIVLMTYEQHQMWEFQTHKIKESPSLMRDWAWVFELKEKLIQEYYTINQIQRWNGKQ